jgi:hypothetical protein
MNHPSVFVVPKVSDGALWLIVNIPSVDDQEREHGREDVEVADLDVLSPHQRSCNERSMPRFSLCAA